MRIKKVRKIICKTCNKEYTTEFRYIKSKFCSVTCFNIYRDKHKLTKDQKREKERVRARKYYSTDKGKQIVKNIAKKWRQINYSKYYARILVNRAVNARKIIKPKVCSRCINTKYIQGHHPDYSKPLEVIWLCISCHRKEHQNLT